MKLTSRGIASVSCEGVGDQGTRAAATPILVHDVGALSNT